MKKRLLAKIGMLLLTMLFIPGMTFAQFDKGPEVDKTKDYYALIITNRGRIAVELYADKAPVTVQNFVNLAEGTAEFKDSKTGEKVKRPYFNGLIFHRVIPNFMIQGGDPTGTGRGGPGYKFADEFSPDLTFSDPGLLAMANAGAGTNGSQFFITEVPTTHLNGKHTIFGKVLEGTDGLEIVKAIARVNHQNTRPVEDVVMEQVKVFRFEKGTDKAAVREAVLGAEGAPAKSATTDAAASKPTPAATESKPTSKPE